MGVWTFTYAQTLLVGKPGRMGESLKAREKHAEEGSGYKWSASVLGLYGHWGKKTGVLKQRWKTRAEIMNTWDKTLNDRSAWNSKVPAVPPHLYELNDDNTQSHQLLWCSHPVVQVARDGFRLRVLGRIRKKDPGPGRAYHLMKWNWRQLLQCQKMVRVGFHSSIIIDNSLVPIRYTMH